MISIRKSTNAIDRLDDLRKEMAACYLLAVRSIAEYAVEIDRGDRTKFQAHLGSLERRWGAITAADTGSSTEMQSIQASLRGEIREYRDRSQERLSHLRRQLDDSATALAGFVSGLESNGSEHEKSLQRELERLNSAASCDDLSTVLQAVREAVSGIGESLERIRRENQAITLQLKDEIRTLHREFEAERRALFTDPQSGSWNRQKLEARIDELIRQNQFFCLLFAAAGNSKSLAHGYPQNIVDDAFQSLVKRFRGAVGPEILVGRWSEEAFVAIMDVPVSAAVPLSRTLQKALAERYAVQRDGESHSLAMQVSTAVIERGEATDAGAFHKKMDQLAAALSNV